MAGCRRPRHRTPARLFLSALLQRTRLGRLAVEGIELPSAEILVLQKLQSVA